MEKVLARQPWSLLEAPLLRAGADVQLSLRRLREYAKLLLEWNRGSSNLMSRHDESRLVERHLLESIAPALWLKESGAARWLDFGSGAGFPAIPLAIAGVAGHWTLVEARRNKTLFIRKTIMNMDLPDIEVVHSRLELMIDEGGIAHSFDGFTSRATVKLGPTLDLAAQWIRPGGSAFVWKGSGREQEMEEDQGWKRFWEFTGLLGVGSGVIVVSRFIRKSAN